MEKEDTMRTHISRRIAVAILAGAFAAMLAAPAGGQVRPDDRAFRGAGPVASAAPARPDDRADRATPQALEPSAVRPDDRAFRAWGPAPTAAPVRPDDRGERHMPDVSRAVESIPGHGFDWLDAGIVAAGALGLALVVGTASLAARRHRRAAALS